MSKLHVVNLYSHTLPFRGEFSFTYSEDRAVRLTSEHAGELKVTRFTAGQPLLRPHTHTYVPRVVLESIS